MQVESQNQDVHFGEGAIVKVAAILDQLGIRKVFLVADELAYHRSGAADELEPPFADCGVERLSNNPIKLSKQGIEKILVKIR